MVLLEVLEPWRAPRFYRVKSTGVNVVAEDRDYRYLLLSLFFFFFLPL